MSRIKEALRKERLAIKGLGRPKIIKKINSIKSPIRLYWWMDTKNSVFNFGDEVSQDIITRLFGYRVCWSPAWECNLIAAGSVLDYMELNCFTNKIDVWGSGYIDKGGKCSKNNFIFHAVRGKYTKNRINSKDNISLGDPGILVNLIYPSSEKTDKIGIVPHYVDLDSPLIKKLKDDDRFIIISPLQKPEIVARQISSCKAVLSSSLHGLIFADSYDVPNAHLILSDKLIGGQYKFKDYCSGVGKKYITFDKKFLQNFGMIEKIIEEYEPIKDKIMIQKKLIRAFPG